MRSQPGSSPPQPSVSVITPAYNSGRYIEETVSSVIGQSFADLELLIVDDGSSDATVAVARRLAQRDARIRVVAPGVNRGAAAARNVAMALARGRYFALLDSDDVWHPGFLTAQMAVFDGWAADVVTGNAYNLGGGSDGLPLAPIASSLRRISLLDMLEREDAVCILSVFRRGVYDAIGGFDERLRHSEDYDFWLRAALAGFCFVHNPAPLARYRRRPDSASANETAMLEAIVEVLRRRRNDCLDMPMALSIIDRQIPRFEGRRLLTRAKAELLRREFGPAADAFAALADVRPGIVNGTIARASRYVPGILLWAYRTRFAIRSRRPRPSV